jgi:hypothetical protein
LIFKDNISHFCIFFEKYWLANHLKKEKIA